MTKVIQIGCGNLAKYLFRFILDSNIDLVSAIDKQSDIIGKDISFVMESNINKGIVIENRNNLDTIIKKTKPDIAIIDSKEDIALVKEELITCLKNKLNVINICSNIDSKSRQEIDLEAKKNQCRAINCTFIETILKNQINNIHDFIHRLSKIVIFIKNEENNNLCKYIATILNLKIKEIIKNKKSHLALTEEGITISLNFWQEDKISLFFYGEPDININMKINNEDEFLCSYIINLIIHNLI